MRSACIAGLGLIGGSIGIALRARGWYVRYRDPHVSLEDARRLAAADAAADDVEGDCDVLVLAQPVDVAIRDLQRMHAASGIVTSVASVMQPLRDVARVPFVAGHPMAGSHESGLRAARGDLFAGKRWFVDDEHPFVEELVRDCGGVLTRVDAREHDAGVALTSHLPQVLSTALAAYLADRDVLRFAGSGLATFLRLAGSDASVWAPVLEANRENLAPHAEKLAELVREIIEGDPREAFEKAQKVARALS
ncbi:MAG TPA: prephenate dehydrogenase/arogenate dehydrogenase family protein [Thermoanaerobaculia bacterium]|jgi:prephenate dehydrogenase